ncbi:MAG: hypothetical protein LUG64_01425, partial [Clostridiales bacterium]|nr:hypothetical protein [Clostridiales bacterium]
VWAISLTFCMTGGSFLFCFLLLLYSFVARLEKGLFSQKEQRTAPSGGCGAAVGFLLRFVKLCGILTVALSNTAAVGPLSGGSFFVPLFWRKGGCPMSTMEVFTLCLVIIGICNLFIQLLNKKK